MSEQNITSSLSNIRSRMHDVRTKTPEDLTRVSAAELLKRHADNLLGDVVLEARAAGRSWGSIGLMLGITRQAVRQRWGPDPDEPDLTAGGRRIHS